MHRRRPAPASSAEATVRLAADVRAATDQARHRWDAAMLAADAALDEHDDGAAARALDEQRQVLRDLERHLRCMLAHRNSSPALHETAHPATNPAANEAPGSPVVRLSAPGRGRRAIANLRSLSAAAACIAVAAAVLSGSTPRVDIAPVPDAATPQVAEHTTVTAAAQDARTTWPPVGVPVASPDVLDRLVTDAAAEERAAHRAQTADPAPTEAVAAPNQQQRAAGSSGATDSLPLPLRLPELPVVADLFDDLERVAEQVRSRLRGDGSGDDASAEGDAVVDEAAQDAEPGAAEAEAPQGDPAGDPSGQGEADGGMARSSDGTASAMQEVASTP